MESRLLADSCKQRAKSVWFLRIFENVWKTGNWEIWVAKTDLKLQTTQTFDLL